VLGGEANLQIKNNANGCRDRGEDYSQADALRKLVLERGLTTGCSKRSYLPSLL
jgi:hypothetical protein